jgi:hypothetical protein
MIVHKAGSEGASGTMIYAGDRQRILAKLINACHDLEDALSQSAPGARYDPVIIPQPLRDELSVLRGDLARIIRQLEESS